MELLFEDKIGAGAWADVWTAEDRALGRKVAVKFFRDVDEGIHRKVVLEHARALARVQHPSVVAVFGVEPQRNPASGEERIAVIMEYVPGETLTRTPGPFSLDRAIALAKALAAGLEAIHDAGLVHGDLHESNIIVTPSGLKILDIMYTRSLAEVGTRTAQKDRMSDVRDFAAVSRVIFERTATVDAREVVEAHFRATSCGSVREALRCYTRLADPDAGVAVQPSAPAGAAGTGAPEAFFLAWVPRNGATMGIETLVFCGAPEGPLRLFGRRSCPVWATRTRLWEVRPNLRPLRLLRASVLERWWKSHGSNETFGPEDHEVVTIDDPALHAIGQELRIPLAGPNPAPLEALELFEMQRTVSLNGAIGSWVFACQYDYVFGGGAHGGVEAHFHAIDLEKMRVVHDLRPVLGDDQHERVTRSHAAVAKVAFREMREDLFLEDSSPMSLVAARPFYSHAYGMDLMLKFIGPASYAGSMGGGWSSYTASEEVALRGLPTHLGPVGIIPRPLMEVLGREVLAVVGWCEVTASHPSLGVLRDLFRSRSVARAL